MVSIAFGVDSAKTSSSLSKSHNNSSGVCAALTTYHITNLFINVYCLGKRTQIESDHHALQLQPGRGETTSSSVGRFDTVVFINVHARQNGATLALRPAPPRGRLLACLHRHVAMTGLDPVRARPVRDFAH